MTPTPCLYLKVLFAAKTKWQQVQMKCHLDDDLRGAAADQNFKQKQKNAPSTNRGLCMGQVLAGRPPAPLLSWGCGGWSSRQTGWQPWQQKTLEVTREMSAAGQVL